MTRDVCIHTLANGMTLLAQPMPHVRSAAFYFLVPAGAVWDPPGQAGAASVLTGMIARGAGDRDNFELNQTLDGLGLDRSESTGKINVTFSGSTLARNLHECLDLYADILRRPLLPADELDAVKSLSIQDIQALDDDPQSKVLVELSKRHYPAPLGNDRRGTVEGIERLTLDEIRHHWFRRFQPNGVILSIAGDVQWEPLRDRIERLFGDWEPGEPTPLTVGTERLGSGHILKELEQTQIGIAFPSVPMGHPDYYAARGAVGVLSDGMSSRLFSEVREKHGLCYAISAWNETFKDRASVLCFTAGKPEKAQELFDRTIHELKRLALGIEAEELARVKAGIKSSLIMRQESTSARAGSIAADWYYLGRVRPIAEIQTAIDALTPDRILEHLHRYPARDFTIVSLGPQPLKI